MAENIVELLTDVADAIREKKGSNEPINAQNFAEEIKNLPSGSSPFAVDFGEEIATGNPTFINALQEDIDYYNEVKARIASGEATKIIWDDADFKRRIAWIPPEMLNEYGLDRAGGCLNLYTYPFDKLTSNMYNSMPAMRRLQSLKVDASEVSRLGYFLCCGNVGEIELTFNNLVEIQGKTLKNITCDKIVVDFPQVTKIANNTFYQISACRIMDINLPILTNLGSSNIRECYDLQELYLNIPNVTSQSNCIYILNKLRICHLKGMQCSFNINDSSVLEIESVKYMLDNCQARADGASYTLTLNAAVKTAFLAKCDEDAEYAASLASATEKGLTLA